VGLENLAERGNSIQHVERQEALILRAMERSRRAMNPNNYNENGTVKKGHKQWNFSKRYQKLRQRHQELCRIATENRALASREQVIIFDPWETALSQNRQMQRNYKKEQIQRIRSIRMDE